MQKSINSLLNTACITSGVTQGSVLGPTLFLLFINDIEDILFGTSVRMKLFADDVKLYSSFACNSHDLQVVCDRLTVWAEEWQIRIAYNKCISHRISNRAAADGNPSYRIGSHVLCWSDETRDFGVTIDNKLSFNSTVCVKLLRLYLPVYMFCCIRASVSGLMALLVLWIFH